MKNSIKIILFSMMTYTASAQTWGGSAVQTGDTYRTGNVGIGTSTPTAALNIANSGALPFFVQRTSGQINGLKLFFTSNPAAGITVGAGSSIFQNTSVTSDILFMPTPTTFGMVIKSNSKVGIGTTSPVTALTVQASTMNDGIRIIQTGTTASALGLFNTSAGARNWALFSTGSGNGQGAGNFSIYDYTAAADRLFIQGSTGNIGIGTTTPSALLNVHDGALRLTGMVAGYGGPQLIFGGNSVTAPNGEWALEYTVATPGKEGMNFWRPAGATGVGGNNFLFLGNNGNVGVGTDNTTAKLTVNGNVLIGDPGVVTIPNANYKLFVETGILTEKVRVAIKNTANWSDYVFADEYKLPELAEVEAFLKTNKHLPNIPSAEEVVKDGIDLGAMDAKLLGKVEELTLYIIALNKEIELLKSKQEQK